MPRAPRSTRRAFAALAVVAAVLALPDAARAAPPTCSVPADFLLTLEAGQSVDLPAAPCSDPDGDAIEIEITRQPTNGTLSPAGRLPIDAPRRYIATSPGNDAIGFRALAGGETSAEQLVPIAVTPAQSVLVVVVPNVIVSFDGSHTRRGTRFDRLVLKGVPRGAKVRVRCRGATCPRRRQTIDDARSTVRLPRFTGTRLAPGTRLEFVVTATERVGVVKRMRIRSAQAPAITTRCIAPGETRRRSCDQDA